MTIANIVAEKHARESNRPLSEKLTLNELADRKLDEPPQELESQTSVVPKKEKENLVRLAG